jgi:ABC-type multidrug transport system ATPase subunit
MSESLFRLVGLTKTYGSRTVLDISSLELTKGGVYALLGHNGGGKSTLLKILAFLDAPTQGSLFYKGNLTTPRNFAKGRGEVVWSPQFPVMFTGSARYNVELPMKIKGLAAKERRKRADEFLAKVSLSHLAEAYAPNLSGGEAQRLSLARSLATGAEVLLLDEPTANIDASSREAFLSLVDDLAKDPRLTIIIATHDPKVEERLPGERLRLVDGRLAAIEEAVIHEAELKDINGEIVISSATIKDQGFSPFRVLSVREDSESVLVTLTNQEKRQIIIRPTCESTLLSKTLSLNSLARFL